MRRRSDSDANTHSDTYANAHSNTYTYTYSDTDANSDACAGTQRAYESGCDRGIYDSDQFVVDGQLW